MHSALRAPGYLSDVWKPGETATHCFPFLHKAPVVQAVLTGPPPLVPGCPLSNGSLFPPGAHPVAYVAHCKSALFPVTAVRDCLQGKNERMHARAGDERSGGQGIQAGGGVGRLQVSWPGGPPPHPTHVMLTKMWPLSETGQPPPLTPLHRFRQTWVLVEYRRPAWRLPGWGTWAGSPSGVVMGRGRRMGAGGRGPTPPGPMAPPAMPG